MTTFCNNFSDSFLVKDTCLLQGREYSCLYQVEDKSCLLAQILKKTCVGQKEFIRSVNPKGQEFLTDKTWKYIIK